MAFFLQSTAIQRSIRRLFFFGAFLSCVLISQAWAEDGSQATLSTFSDPTAGAWTSCPCPKLGRSTPFFRLEIPLSRQGIAGHQRPDASSSPHRQLRRIDLDQHLEKTHAWLASSHFLLRFPKEISRDYARRVTAVLEEELRRLRVWIPAVPSGRKKPFEVLFFPEELFEKVYGPAVLGIFDGSMRIPITRLGDRSGVLTSSLTHELVHALVADQTGNGVPYWFQEGLAQYLEHDYEIPDLGSRPNDSAISLLVIDEALAGLVDPGPDLVDRAYRESAWVVHFLGSRYGISGIRRLLLAFAARGRSDAAIEDALGISRAELERDLGEWRRLGGPRAPVPRSTWAVGIYDWYRDYEQRIQPAKISLRPIVAALREWEALPSTESCRQLSDDLDLLLADRRFLQCPHIDVRQALLEAFEHFRRLTDACWTGHLEGMRTELGHAEAALGTTAALLEPYGLLP